MNLLQSIQSVALVFIIVLIAWDWTSIAARFKRREARYRELETDEKRCPYCHDAFGDEADTESRVTCDLCESEHHSDCFEENGHCAVYACGSKNSRQGHRSDRLKVDSLSSAG